MASYPVAMTWASELPHRLTQSRPWLIVLLVATLIWGWVDVRQRGYPYPEEPEQHKSDLTVYTEAGAAFFDGRPPYSVCNVRGCTYVYPPLFALLLAPLHVLPMQDQVTVWFFLCLCMCWGCYYESRRIVQAICGPRVTLLRWFPWLGAATAAAATIPTLNCLQRGQVTVVVLYGMLLGLRLVLCSRTPWGWIAGGIALALPISIKVIPALPVGLLLVMQLVATWHNYRQRQPNVQVGGRFAGSAVGLGFGMLLFLFLIPAALIGWNANLRHLSTWSHDVLSSAQHSTTTPGFQNDTHSARNQCLGNAIYRLGNFASYTLAGGPEDPLVDDERMPPRLMDAPVVDHVLLWVRVALLLTVCLTVFQMARGGDLRMPRHTWTGQQVGLREADRLITRHGIQDQAMPPLLNLAAGFGLACVAMLVLSPVARGHYFMLWTPAVLFVPLWLDQQKMPRAATAMAVAPAVLTIVHYVLLPVAGRLGVLGIGSTCWLMAAFVLIDRAGRSAIAVPATANHSIPTGCFSAPNTKAA
jgi:hypothetical protein